MKTLVIYYSRDGHTRKIAEEIAKIISADIKEIHEKKSRAGCVGWLTAGKDACMRKITKIEDLKIDFGSYDLVIIGTPIWSWNMTSAVRSFLNLFAHQIKQVAFFATMGGSGDKRAFAEMAEICGKTSVPTATFIDKKIDRDEYKAELDLFVEKLTMGS